MITNIIIYVAHTHHIEWIYGKNIQNKYIVNDGIDMHMHIDMYEFMYEWCGGRLSVCLAVYRFRLRHASGRIAGIAHVYTLDTIHRAHVYTHTYVYWFHNTSYSLHMNHLLHMEEHLLYATNNASCSHRCMNNSLDINSIYVILWIADNCYFDTIYI